MEKVQSRHTPEGVAPAVDIEEVVESVTVLDPPKSNLLRKMYAVNLTALPQPPDQQHEPDTADLVPGPEDSSFHDGSLNSAPPQVSVDMRSVCRCLARLRSKLFTRKVK